MTTNSEDSDCATCIRKDEPIEHPVCSKCVADPTALFPHWAPQAGHEPQPTYIYCGGKKCGQPTCKDCFPVLNAMPENPKAIYGRAKPNLALIPGAAAVQVAGVFALGASKYGPFNWRRDHVEAETYVAAAQRHILSWFDGENIDPESGESHLAHAASCMLLLLDAEACGKLIDNRPTSGVSAALIQQRTKKVDYPSPSV